uniref:Isochorismatase-like domain-containing protein n=1 Tax=Pyrodinium bahamense TaxID=73915 RepID=A0A7S0AVX4_9DINO|mmetsp:Transcript_43515/g.120937  ORF Transcript_43515/g.120937 Transcript_43515/m.120937 type:complete len:268 (+) Transcript_43515:3-806(+)
MGSLLAWPLRTGTAARDGAWVVLGMVMGFFLSRSFGFLTTRRLAALQARPLPLRRFVWGDFCLLLVHLQRDRCSRNAAVREACPGLGERVAELVALCRARGIEVVHLRDGSAPRISPWHGFWLRMNPNGDASADPAAPEDFAAERAGERVFVGPGYDGVGVDTGLEPHLRAKGRSVVLVCGLTTSCSVHLNALGLFLRGYETFVVGDCCGDRTAKIHQGTLRRECRRSYAVCSLEGVKALLDAGPRFDLLTDFRFVPANTTQFEMCL